MICTYYVLSQNRNYFIWCLCFYSFQLITAGVFSVIVYFGILKFPCQITSVIYSVFLNFDCCCWYEGGQKWNRTFRCICCLLQCSMGFHTPQNSGLNVSCKILMSFTTSFCFCMQITFFFSHHWVLVCFFLWGFFFPILNSLNLFLAFVLPTKYYFQNLGSYSRCSICYCTSDCCSSLNIWMICRKG